MTSPTFTLSLLALVFCSVVQSQKVREGHCPLIIPDYEGACTRECENDADCATETDRCCQNACAGTYCVEPKSEDPCDNHECKHPGELCVNEGTHSVCKCGEVCPQNYDPVCGYLDEKDKEGQEYPNRCVMQMKMCELQITIDEIDCDRLGERLGIVDTESETDGASSLVAMTTSIITVFVSVIQLL
ncbi:WAP, Kazal, immunoglobulin, Kunitz and NTR domain-containing protein-like isoform X2 [Saccoglossus kowalevskii]|uniref:WAP, Kazal, immunoglobulin, Kunitz and NTR domain-containing protein 1-like isoform X1 n=1 Tax=Saccoglossus kowalevskii TaxID=10224 RepID=A0ABM0MSW4_SACKO|nr:PREDICTED: WAP, Kazal, immunoglobulin, Kunitz and NTR domain-containing protein 1-like isoform X1 [Saccoglossus kowalevskii]XP_006823105.1 PREDICTED: WAP, Kazal, immunoglobulin, Kunitz and NTR domain-containing protein 1-like isoform X2 [Saccoglossus kowalevskii]